MPLHCRRLTFGTVAQHSGERMAQHGAPGQPVQLEHRGAARMHGQGVMMQAHEVKVAMDSRNRSAAPAKSRVAARNVASYTCPDAKG